MNTPTLAGKPYDALLLAAGMGSRLGPLTAHKPKCMTRVRDATIVERAFDALKAAGVKRVVVVTGYMNTLLEDYLHSISQDVELVFVHNPDYATTNNIYSLWLARQAVTADFILVESDVLFSKEIAAKLLPPGAAAISPLQDWMNGTVVTLNDGLAIDGFYLKNDPRPPRELFKTVNLYSFDLDIWKNVVIPRLDRAVESGNIQLYYEAVFAEATRDRQLAFRAVNCDDLPWFEIDTPDDLTEATKRAL